MSNSSGFPEEGRFHGRRIVKGPEKSNFSQTCNLLSQYLKEKGSFGDLSLGMTCNLEGKGRSEPARPTTTIDLLPRKELSGEASASERKNGLPERNPATGNPISLNTLPQYSGFGPTPTNPTVEYARKKSDLRTGTEQETAQMTIFYAGRVLVFDNFPADKAKELMLFASRGSPQNSGPTSASGNDTGNLLHYSNANVASTSGNNPAPEELKRPQQPDPSDLPIARKASLHRFLEKRKDRINSKAPYQLNPESPTPPLPTESKSWLGLASQAE